MLRSGSRSQEHLVYGNDWVPVQGLDTGMYGDDWDSDLTQAISVFKAADWSVFTSASAITLFAA